MLEIAMAAAAAIDVAIASGRICKGFTFSFGAARQSGTHMLAKCIEVRGLALGLPAEACCIKGLADRLVVLML